MSIEIERKFLLKSLPDSLPSEIIKIDQFYFKNKDGVWERVRQCDSNVYGKKWVHTIKNRISERVNEEIEREITKKEFDRFKRLCYSNKLSAKHIKKDRWIFPDGELKWEVDLFKDNYHLVIAEIETPTEDWELNIPDFINKKLLLEVTGMKQFSNRSLSIKLK
jgi:CYTH domain-containing protein